MGSFLYLTGTVMRDANDPSPAYGIVGETRRVNLNFRNTPEATRTMIDEIARLVKPFIANGSRTLCCVDSRVQRRGWA